MNYLHEEEYNINYDTFFHFYYDKSRKKAESTKKKMRVVSVINLILCVVIVVFLGPKFNAFKIFAAIYAIFVLIGFKKSPIAYENNIKKNIEQSYEQSNYKKTIFNVKFYKDKMVYTLKDTVTEYSYNDLMSFTDNENYFLINLVSGTSLIFNPTCNKDKIREIIRDYRVKGEDEENTENIKNIEESEVKKEETEIK